MTVGKSLDSIIKVIKRILIHRRCIKCSKLFLSKTEVFRPLRCESCAPPRRLRGRNFHTSAAMSIYVYLYILIYSYLSIYIYLYICICILLPVGIPLDINRRRNPTRSSPSRCASRGSYKGASQKRSPRSGCHSG